MSEDDVVNRDSEREEIAEARAMREVVEGTAHVTGVDFFRKLVELLAKSLGTQHALIAEFSAANRVRTLAYWQHDHLAENFEYELSGTPCQEVVQGNLCHYPTGVWRNFPNDLPLVDMQIESYLGVPLIAPNGNHLGHLCVFDPRPLMDESSKVLVFRLFAARAAAELERLRLEQELSQSEQRFRDLYDEAPIAYVQEDLQSRFINANRAAMRILGITPEEVPGCVGMSFIPDTPEAQARVKNAFESIGRGTDTSGVVLELRRRDNGMPIWIQWWSRPDPSGLFTRTMFVDITEQILMEREKHRLEAQNDYLREEIKSVHNFEEIVGRSPALLTSLDKVNRVAVTDTTVLITGETGTGKELVARAIHSASPRREKPLIKLNCAALPSGLVESELFGHEKGAFSGAVQRRCGRFELANHGTIFLDEIGELSLEVQAKLLRVLQEREFERIGGSETISVDVRIIAATNRDLRKLVKSGGFREDLYYRLDVIPIDLPSLRARKDDIPLLVQFFIQKHAARVDRRIDRVEEETMQRLIDYSWPGNIRELQNVIERAMILTNGPELQIEPEVFMVDFSPESTGFAGNSNSSLRTLERDHILRVLRSTDWIIEGDRGAARQLGLHPNTLRSRLKKMGITRETNG